MKKSDWFIIVCYFFTVAGAKFLQLSFLWFLLWKNWQCFGE